MYKEKIIEEILQRSMVPFIGDVPRAYDLLQPKMVSRLNHCSDSSLETIVNSAFANTQQLKEMRMMLRETHKDAIEEARKLLEAGRIPGKTVLIGIEALAQGPDGRLIARDGSYLEKEVENWWFDPARIGRPPFESHRLPMRISIGAADGQGTWENYDIGTQLYKKLYIIHAPKPRIMSSGTGHGQRCVEMNIEGELYYGLYTTLAQPDCGIYETPSLEIDLLVAVQGMIVFQNIFAILNSGRMYPRIGIPIFFTWDHSMGRGRVFAFGIDGENWDVLPIEPYAADGCGRTHALGTLRNESSSIVHPNTHRLILKEQDAVKLAVKAGTHAIARSAGCGGAISVRVVGPSGFKRITQKVIYDHVQELGEINFGAKIPDYETWLKMADLFDNFDETCGSLTKVAKPY